MSKLVHSLFHQILGVAFVPMLPLVSLFNFLCEICLRLGSYCHLTLPIVGTLLRILVYTFLFTCFYIICVCWIRICRITSYIFGDLHLHISKTQNDHQMLRKPHIFYSLSHRKAWFMVPVRFLFDDFFLVSLERNYLYLTFKYKTSAVLYVFTVTISILLNMLAIIWHIWLGIIVTNE